MKDALFASEKPCFTSRNATFCDVKRRVSQNKTGIDEISLHGGGLQNYNSLIPACMRPPAVSR